MKKIIVTATILLLLATNAHALTLTQQIARTREYLHQTDSANSIYSDTVITEAINSGQRVLENLLSASANKENFLITGCAYTTGSVSITAPTGLKKILEVYDVATTRPYIQLKHEEAHRLYLATTKDPMFIVNAGTITFKPAATSSGTLEVSYQKSYTRLTSGTDTVTVQDRYLEMLTLASAWYVLQQDGQANRAAAIYKQLSDLASLENSQSVNSDVIEKGSGK